MTKSADQIRLEQILIRLETRSGQCPGMFPVTTREHWQQLGLLHEPAAQESMQELWQTLEAFDRDPELAHQALNHLLAQQSPVQLMSVDADPKTTARERLAAVNALLAPDHFRYNKKHG